MKMKMMTVHLMVCITLVIYIILHFFFVETRLKLFESNDWAVTLAKLLDEENKTQLVFSLSKVLLKLGIHNLLFHPYC